MVKRQRFTAEFKREAVRLLDAGERPASEVAIDLGIRRNQLYKWNKQKRCQGLFFGRRITEWKLSLTPFFEIGTEHIRTPRPLQVPSTIRSQGMRLGFIKKLAFITPTAKQGQIKIPRTSQRQVQMVSEILA